MDQTAREAYLEAQVMTATPQKLRLVLIEGALRYARLAHESQTNERHDEAFDASVRCRRLVTELFSSIDPQQSALNRQVVALYIYLFQSITEAQLRRDSAKFLDVIRVLEIERDTWRDVCEKMPLAPRESTAAPSKEVVARGPAILPHFAGPQSTAFSLDA